MAWCGHCADCLQPLHRLNAIAQTDWEVHWVSRKRNILDTEVLLCFVAAVTLAELHTKEKAVATSTAELAERQADLQAREAALKGAQASLEAQLQQLASEQQASP